MRAWIFVVLICMGFCFKASALTVNISKNKILIGVDFAGDVITVFGKKEDEGDIVIIFKSQKVSYKVYGKQKIFGIWQNTNPRIFKDIYNIYSLKSENADILTRDDIFRDLEIGVQNVNFYNFTNVKSALLNSDYKDAFLKHKKKNGSFKEDFGNVRFFPKSGMFLANVEIPSNIKPGNYSLEVFLIRDKELRELMIFDIRVEQVGMLLKIKELSQLNKEIYAVVSILISVIIAFLAFSLAKVLYYNRV
jgi:uncharacterized protein (TIGR02186 family)